MFARITLSISCKQFWKFSDDIINRSSNSGVRLDPISSPLALELVALTKDKYQKSKLKQKLNDHHPLTGIGASKRNQSYTCTDRSQCWKTLCSVAGVHSSLPVPPAWRNSAPAFTLLSAQRSVWLHSWTQGKVWIQGAVLEDNIS